MCTSSRTYDDCLRPTGSTYCIKSLQQSCKNVNCMQDSLIYKNNYEMIPFYFGAESCPSGRMVEYRTTLLQFSSNLLSPSFRSAREHIGTWTPTSKSLTFSLVKLPLAECRGFFRILPLSLFTSARSKMFTFDVERVKFLALNVVYVRWPLFKTVKAMLYWEVRHTPRE